MGVYNFGNGVLSARGDTKRPLYYLAAAGVLNVILNLFFVIVLHMAAAGVATATAIAQYVSAMLIMVHLLRRKDECHVSLKKIRFHKKASGHRYPGRYSKCNLRDCKPVCTEWSQFF